MELSPFATQVRSALESAAALGDDRTREIAAGLGAAAEPAVRLALVAAVSAAADEITALLLDLPDAPTITPRLAVADGMSGGGDVEFDVRPRGSDGPAAAPADDAEASARISLRLSETLKTDIEVAARTDAVSVNTWLVRAAAAALQPPAGGRERTARSGSSTSHVTGWING